MELREMRAFVATVEQGGLSAAARTLHLSQPALSQTVNSLERQFGVQLLVRSSTGVTATEAGSILHAESKAVLARHDQAIAAVLQHSQAADHILRVGVPLELPSQLLPSVFARLGEAFPQTRVQVRHLSTAAQLDALQTEHLDLGLTRERPTGQMFDAVRVLEERLGVLLAAERAAELEGPSGVRLDALSGLDWVGFARSGSPAWHDEVTAVLRGHGIDIGRPAAENEPLIAEVKLAAVQGGRAFAFAPSNWSQPIPDGVRWCPLVDSPLVRRTWAVWAANSRRRDLGYLVDALDSSAGTPLHT